MVNEFLTLLFGGLTAIVIWIVLLIFWIFTMVKQLKNKEWTWFVLTLIFSYIILVIYWIRTGLKKLD